MKPFFMAVLFFCLAGCAALPSDGQGASRSEEQQLMAEAQSLAPRIARGDISRVQAAEKLGRLRLQLVGWNAVDDDLYRVYFQIAQLRDAGKIDSPTAQRQMETRLQYWLRRWPAYSPKPANPAFTRFLLKLYGLPSLPDNR